MRFLLPSCALLFGCLLPAQVASPAAPAAPASAAELAAAKARLAGALQKCGALADTAFAMRWGPDKKKKGGDDPFAKMMAAMNSGEAKGSWHQDLAHVAFQDDNDDELLIAGRRTLAKDGNLDWRLRQGRFADGNTVAFVPNVPLLLQQLAEWDLAVTQRSVGSLDDKPVEIVSVTLNAEQVADLVWAGLLPEALVTANAMGGITIMRGMAAGGGGNRPPAQAPDSTVDLAIHLDPATNLIHKLHFRGWSKENQGGMARAGGAMVMVQAGAARVVGGNQAQEEEEEEDEKETAAKKDAPLVYENGLPARPRKKTSVTDVTVSLSQHGKKTAPTLSDAQKKLLGR